MIMNTACRWGAVSPLMVLPVRAAPKHQGYAGGTRQPTEAVEIDRSPHRLASSRKGNLHDPDGIAASDKHKRAFGTFVSHSTWKEQNADTPEMKHTWDDIKKTGGKTINISDQNRNLSTDCAERVWLKQFADEAWRRLYHRPKRKRFDAPDVGLMWFVLTAGGNQNGTPAKVRESFETTKGNRQ